jgi:hypothetical protein
MSDVTRDQLVEALAKSSHEVYERHYRESGRPLEGMTVGLHKHYHDRANAAVEVLEELGVWTDPERS